MKTGGTYYQDVECNQGELVVGGGYDFNDSITSLDNTTVIPNVHVFMSMPSDGASRLPDGATPTGWRVGLYRAPQDFPTQFTVYVLCAAAA